MLVQLLLFILNAVVGFLSGVLLVRFLMQWMRAPFRNPVGNFVVAATDWLVRPARRFIPGLMGLDLASLIPAWLLQTLMLVLTVALHGGHPGPVLLLAGLVETLRTVIHLLIILVIASAVLSWVNPYSPLAPLLHHLSQPLLRPFQRIIPTVGNVDLSPLAALLLLQVGLFLLDAMTRSLVGFAAY